MVFRSGSEVRGSAASSRICCCTPIAPCGWKISSRPSGASRRPAAGRSSRSPSPSSGACWATTSWRPSPMAIGSPRIRWASTCTGSARLVTRGREALACGDPRRRLRTSWVWRSRSGAARRLPTSTTSRSWPPNATILEASRLAAIEDRIDAELALGREHALIGELEGLVAAEPLRERPRAQLMIALYRAGRQSEALGVYRSGAQGASGAGRCRAQPQAEAARAGNPADRTARWNLPSRAVHRAELPSAAESTDRPRAESSNTCAPRSGATMFAC